MTPRSRWSRKKSDLPPSENCDSTRALTSFSLRSRSMIAVGPRRLASSAAIRSRQLLRNGLTDRIGNGHTDPDHLEQARG